jgi:hypothetical protein
VGPYAARAPPPNSAGSTPPLTRRRGAGENRARGDPHLLQRRPQPSPRMGMGLRGLPGLRLARPAGYAKFRAEGGDSAPR